uniref:Uncharacterized protein n=1 Tax=Poecilia mexicana TaxID=48701 RepID=A0A3B3YJI1_9TELE
VKGEQAAQLLQAGHLRPHTAKVLVNADLWCSIEPFPPGRRAWSSCCLRSTAGRCCKHPGLSERL